MSFAESFAVGADVKKAVKDVKDEIDSNSYGLPQIKTDTAGIITRLDDNTNGLSKIKTDTGNIITSLGDSTNGLTAIKGKEDDNYNLLTNGTYGLSALKTAINASGEAYERMLCVNTTWNTDLSSDAYTERLVVNGKGHIHDIIHVIGTAASSNKKFSIKITIDGVLRYWLTSPSSTGDASTGIGIVTPPFWHGYNGKIYALYEYYSSSAWGIAFNMLDTTFSESMNNMVTSDPLENTETSTINAKIKYFLKERPIPFYSGFKIETTTQGRCALFAKYSVAV